MENLYNLIMELVAPLTTAIATFVLTKLTNEKTNKSLLPKSSFKKFFWYFHKNKEKFMQLSFELIFIYAVYIIASRCSPYPFPIISTWFIPLFTYFELTVLLFDRIGYIFCNPEDNNKNK